MADYKINILAEVTGLDKAEQQIRNILKLNGETVRINVETGKLDQQIQQIQKGMTSSGKVGGTNFSKGFIGSVKAIKAPTLKEVVNLNKRIKSDTEKALKDIKIFDPGIDQNVAKKSASQYVNQKVKAEQKAQSEVEKERQASLKQIEKIEESSAKRQAQQRIAEMKTNASLKNAPHDAWVKIGQDNIKQWKKNYSEVEKIQKDISQGKLGTITSGIQKSLNSLDGIDSNKLSSAKESFKELTDLQKELESGVFKDNKETLGASDYIDKMDKFNDVAKKMKNEVKTLSNEFSGLNKPISILDAIGDSNKTLKWLQKNTAAVKDYGEAFEALAKKQRTATTQGERQQYQKEFNNLVSDATLNGKTGRSFTQELYSDVKRLGSAFSAIGLIQNVVSDVPQQIYQAVSQVDSAITDLRMATGVSKTEAMDLMDTYGSLGDQLKATRTDIAASSTEWLKQGKSIKEANSLTQDSIVLSKIGDLSSQDATKTITAAMKSYDLQTDEVMDFVDQISAVDMASATDVGGLATAFNEVAANAKQAGISTQELLGYAAVIGETTQEGMASVGTSLNSIFARMGNIKLSRLKDYETGEDLSNVETVLRGVGIQTRETNDEFRDFDDILDDIGSRYDSFSGVQQRAIAQAVAG